MKKGLLCTLASLLLGTSLASLAGGAIPMPPPFFSDNIKLVLSGAVAIMPQTEIIEGVVNDNVILNDGLNDDDVFATFSPGFEAWFPLMTWNDSQLNAVALTNFIPGDHIDAAFEKDRRHHHHHHNHFNAANGNLGHTDRVTDNTVTIKDWRLNWGIGLNYLFAFDEYYFVEAMIGAGVDLYHAKAEFIADDDNANNSGADHPGASTYNPFVMAELGLGMRVSEKSLVMLFADGAWVNHDDNFILAQNNDDDGFVNLEPQEWWVLIGLKFARSIDL